MFFFVALCASTPIHLEIDYLISLVGAAQFIVDLVWKKRCIEICKIHANVYKLYYLDCKVI